MDRGLISRPKNNEGGSKRNVGVVSKGIRAPIIRPGDDLPEIVLDSLSKAMESDGIVLENNNIIGVTEAVVAKAQRNFATLTDVGRDISDKFGENETIGIVFPILSRNRFSKILEAISLVAGKIYIQLSYPADEVGNHLISQEKLDDSGINPYSDSLTEKAFYAVFGETRHEITGMNYVDFYKRICNGKAEVIFSNNPTEILKYTKKVLVADIHTRHRTKRMLRRAGAEIVYGLDGIMSEPINDSGYNADYGLLGSNLSSDDRLKLFPKDCQAFVNKVQDLIRERYHVTVQVMVYGDGAYKDPTSKIWEEADPVVSPGYTEGLGGTPNEIKFKLVADTDLKDIPAAEAQEKLKEMIRNKSKASSIPSQGTTPRKIVDLVGSLCDLMSGSGDKGTPFVLIQGYFDNYSDD